MLYHGSSLLRSWEATDEESSHHCSGFKQHRNKKGPMFKVIYSDLSPFMGGNLDRMGVYSCGKLAEHGDINGISTASIALRIEKLRQA